ncbi:helix-turn-helix domain-containing protein [Nonomuraea jabiensis]|nr:helix-turn-helix transcriptional regulator [Nonomuraea jabiensis]
MRAHRGPGVRPEHRPPPLRRGRPDPPGLDLRLGPPPAALPRGGPAGARPERSSLRSGCSPWGRAWRRARSSPGALRAQRPQPSPQSGRVPTPGGLRFAKTSLSRRRLRPRIPVGDLAERMGVTKGRISQIEQGKISGQDVLARYASALGGRLHQAIYFDDGDIAAIA